MTKAKAIQWIQMNEMPDLQIFNAVGQNPAIISHDVVDPSDGDLESAIAWFENAVTLLTPGKYKIIAKKNAKAGSGRRSFNFQVFPHDLDHAATQQPLFPSMHGPGGMEYIQGLISKEVAAARAQMEMERKVEAYRLEVAALQEALKEKNSWQAPMSFLAQRAAEHIMTKSGYKLPPAGEEEPTKIPTAPPPGVAGAEGSGGEDSDLDTRYDAAITNLCNKTGDQAKAVSILETLSKLSPETLDKITTADPDTLDKIKDIDPTILSALG